MDDEGKMKSAQAHQVIGVLWGGAKISEAEFERALDYFSNGKYNPDFLPWPR